jgi:predicted transcriptional regulator
MDADLIVGAIEKVRRADGDKVFTIPNSATLLLIVIRRSMYDGSLFSDLRTDQIKI